MIGWLAGCFVGWFIGLVNPATKTGPNDAGDAGDAGDADSRHSGSCMRTELGCCFRLLPLRAQALMSRFFLRTGATTRPGVCHRKGGVMGTLYRGPFDVLILRDR